MEGSRRPGGGTPRSDRRSCGLWLTGSWSRCRRTAAARGRRSACHLLCAPRGAEVPCAATRTSPQEWGAGGWPNDCHGALAAMQRRVRSRPSDEMTSSAVTVGLLDRGTSCGRRRGAVPAPGRTLVAESVGSQWAPAYPPTTDMVRRRRPARLDREPSRRRMTVRPVGRSGIVRGHDRLELQGQQVRVGPHAVEDPLAEPPRHVTFGHDGGLAAVCSLWSCSGSHAAPHREPLLS